VTSIRADATFVLFLRYVAAKSEPIPKHKFLGKPAIRISGTRIVQLKAITFGINRQKRSDATAANTSQAVREFVKADGNSGQQEQLPLPSGL
jgi:hypothetical protein